MLKLVKNRHDARNVEEPTVTTTSKIAQAEQALLAAQEHVAHIRREGREAQDALRALAPLPEGVSGENFAARQAEEHNLRAKIARLKDDLAVAQREVEQADKRLLQITARVNRLPKLVLDIQSHKRTLERHDLPRAQEKLHQAKRYVDELAAMIAQDAADLVALEAEYVSLTGKAAV
jgi:chromosome segregation ATPase